MQVHLFGVATPTGDALRQQILSSCLDLQLIPYSRRVPDFISVDFNDPGSFVPGGSSVLPSQFVSLGPIWDFAPFMARMVSDYPERLEGVRAVIACSSSSVVTKRFAVNRFDRQLVSRLFVAEQQLLTTCEAFGLHCYILRPTIIYGRSGSYTDRNLSRLISLMRNLPILPLPSESGLRQPIHVTQLASVMLKILSDFKEDQVDIRLPQVISLGGDVELSYIDMLKFLQDSLPLTDPARRCFLLPLPARFFQALASPLLLFSPKMFEAVLRISADLAGFIPSHQFLGSAAQEFPLSDLS